MNIKESTLEYIRTNENAIRELSIELDLTCEQVKDILIEDSLNDLYFLRALSEDEIIEYLTDKYLEK